MPDTVADARELIRLASRTPSLLFAEQRRLQQLSLVVASQPEQVWFELEDIRRNFSNRVPVYSPQDDYARCISIAQYWKYCLPDPTRDEFQDAGDYEDFLKRSPDPKSTALVDLIGPDDDELVPAAHSWIVPLDKVRNLTRAELSTLLQLRAPRLGAFVILVLPRAKLIQFGCTVRQPAGIDAIHKRNFQWKANAVPDERIDGPIYRGTVGGIMWKP